VASAERDLKECRPEQVGRPTSCAFKCKNASSFLLTFQTYRTRNDSPSCEVFSPSSSTGNTSKRHASGGHCITKKRVFPFWNPTRRCGSGGGHHRAGMHTSENGDCGGVRGHVRLPYEIDVPRAPCIDPSAGRVLLAERVYVPSAQSRHPDIPSVPPPASNVVLRSARALFHGWGFASRPTSAAGVIAVSVATPRGAST